jgi:hypothetical protein
MASNAKPDVSPISNQSLYEIDVLTGREGKHKRIVIQLLSDLEQLEAGRALKIPFTALPGSKENICSVLNRATRQKNMEVATSSDDGFLYIWKVEPQS